MASKKRHLFVWRGGSFANQTVYRESCPYCNLKCVVDRRFLTKSVDGIDCEQADSQCPLCGWSSGYSISDNLSFHADIIRAFDINSAEVPLTELGTHLKQHFADVYTLSPRRFEHLIADVFRDQSYSPYLTKATRDGGVDVFLVNDRTGSIEVIIECKRYSPDRRVGIAAVQRLVGAAVEWGTCKAYLVTTSSYTASARKSEERIVCDGRIELDLLEAADVMSLLQAYNEELPPLHLLNREVREAIIKGNGGWPFYPAP